MGLAKRIRDFVAPEEAEEELELTREEAKSLSEYEQPQVKGASKIVANADIVLFEPRVFDEAEEIANHLKAKKACAINLHRMPSEYRQRLIDFLTGVIHALDGTINKVGGDVILCSPKTINVAGEITEQQ